MQTVITITEKDQLKRAVIARSVREAAARLPERLEEGPAGTFRFTDWEQAEKGNQPLTVSHSRFRNITGIKIKNVPEDVQA